MSFGPTTFALVKLQGFSSIFFIIRFCVFSLVTRFDKGSKLISSTEFQQGSHIYIIHEYAERGFAMPFVKHKH